MEEKDIQAWLKSNVKKLCLNLYEIIIIDFHEKPADFSPKALINNDIKFQGFLERLNFIDKNKLNRVEQISLLIQQRQLQNHMDQFSFKSHYMLLTSK